MATYGLKKKKKRRRRAIYHKNVENLSKWFQKMSLKTSSDEL